MYPPFYRFIGKTKVLNNSCNQFVSNFYPQSINIFCRVPEWIRNVQMIPCFSARLRWKRGWKSCMANSKDWRSENVNMIGLNCNVVKKVATPPPPPPFLHQPPPLSGLSPLSSKQFRTPPKWLNFWNVLPPLYKMGGGGESNCVCFKWSVKKHCVAKISQRTWETFLYENKSNSFSKLLVWYITRNISVFCL